MRLQVAKELNTIVEEYPLLDILMALEYVCMEKARLLQEENLLSRTGSTMAKAADLLNEVTRKLVDDTR